VGAAVAVPGSRGARRSRRGYTDDRYRKRGGGNGAAGAHAGQYCAVPDGVGAIRETRRQMGEF
jgi:hypothetical protein